MNTSPATQPQSETDKLHFLDYWQVITKRKEVIIATAVILILGVTGYSFMVQPKYTATSQIHVERSPSLRPFLPASTEAFMTNTLDETEFNTYQREIASGGVLQKVIEGRVTRAVYRCDLCGAEYSQDDVVNYQISRCVRPGCNGRVGRREEPKYPDWVDLRRKWAKDDKKNEPYSREVAIQVLRSRVKVGAERGTRLINISYTSPDRNEVAAIANMIAEVYKQHQEEESGGRVDDALSAIVEQGERLQQGFGTKKGILQLEAERDNFKHERKLLITGEDRVVQHFDLNTFRARLLDLEVQIVGLEERLRGLDRIGREERIAALQGYEALDQLKRERQEQELLYQQRLVALGPDDQEVKQLGESLEKIDNKIDAEVTTILNTMHLELNVLQERTSELGTQIETLQACLSDLGEKSRQGQIALLQNWLAEQEAALEQRIVARGQNDPVAEQLAQSIAAIEASIGDEAAADIGDAVRAELGRLEALKSELVDEIASGSKRLKDLEQIGREERIAALQGNQALYSFKHILAEQKIILEQTRAAEIGETNPQIVRLKKAIEDLEVSIDKEVQGILNSMRIDLDTLKSRKKQLEEAIGQKEKEIFKIEVDLSTYKRLDREVERRQNIYNQLMTKQYQEFISKDIPASRIRVTQEASRPTRPSKPHKFFNILVGVFVGLTVGTGLAYFIEYLDTSVKTIDDLERNLNMPILGVIPQRVKLLTEVTHKSPAYEAYRMLWTNIEFARQDSKLRTVLVTSGGVGEGKTTSLVNLAIVIAREGNRVLVIDSDFRRPRVHKLLGLSNQEGLTDVLMRGLDPERLAVKTEVPNLWVLPSGKLPPSSMGLLNSRNMRECIESLYDKYDLILFDSPPVIGVSDASVLAGLVDRIVLVVEYRKYPRSVATRAKKILENVGGQILGGVINNLNIVKEDYYYYSQVYHYFQASGEEQAAEQAADEAAATTPETTETTAEGEAPLDDDPEETV